MEGSRYGPISQEEGKNSLENYYPVRLRPIFGKTFEREIYKLLFNYFLNNKLFTATQSGFIPGGSCIAQLLSIIHEIQVLLTVILPLM